MTERLTLHLADPKQGYAAMRAAWPSIFQMLEAGKRLVLEVRPEKRNDPQNRLLHASVADIAKQCEWAGRKWDVESWKRLLVAAWCRANAQGVELVPAIDGAGFDVLYRRTSKLSKSECSELQEFIYAWGVEHGVKFSEPPERA